MKLRGSIVLLLVAIIWGTAFSAQRAGMAYMEPFAFNGVRFALGAVSLMPLLYFFRRQKTAAVRRRDWQKAWRAGGITGLIMLIDLSFQQVGLVYTTAGKAAFITCLYLIIVPLAGVFFRQRIGSNVWLGAILSLVGLYFLCITDDFSLSFGDSIILGSAVFGALHILAIGHYARNVDWLELACAQFVVCAAGSLFMAICLESFAWNQIKAAAIPILYGGVLSVGVAYTLQIYGQRYAAPTQAVIIMSMESVFGAISGYIFLKEILSLEQIGGCLLMLTGVILSQVNLFRRFGDNKRESA